MTKEEQKVYNRLGELYAEAEAEGTWAAADSCDLAANLRRELRKGAYKERYTWNQVYGFCGDPAFTGRQQEMWHLLLELLG